MSDATVNRCRADRDGDCGWIECPQLLEGEPEKSGRHCPLDLDCSNPAEGIEP